MEFTPMRPTIDRPMPVATPAPHAPFTPGFMESPDISLLLYPMRTHPKHDAAHLAFCDIEPAPRKQSIALALFESAGMNGAATMEDMVMQRPTFIPDFVMPKAPMPLLALLRAPLYALRAYLRPFLPRDFFLKTILPLLYATCMV